MTENMTLAEKVYQIAQAARSGNIDPLEISLLASYKELQEFQSALILIHIKPILFWLLSSNLPAKTAR